MRAEQTTGEALAAWDAFTDRVPAKLTSARSYLDTAREHAFTCLDPALRRRLARLGGPSWAPASSNASRANSTPAPPSAVATGAPLPAGPTHRAHRTTTAPPDWKEIQRVTHRPTTIPFRLQKFNECRWLVPILHAHLERYPVSPEAPIYANAVGKPLRRTLFRTASGDLRLCRQECSAPSPSSTAAPGGRDVTGATLVKEFPTEREAVLHIAKSCVGGLRFHDFRHSYATWLVDGGVPMNMVQRVMGHERSLTTLDLHPSHRRSRSHLAALDDVC